MTKTEKYSEILTKFLTDFANEQKDAVDGLTTLVITDKERHHYQSVIHGFNEEQYKHTFMVLFHFDIIDEKIWIQVNNTDWDFEETLIQKGIASNDLVIGWLPKFARQKTSKTGEKASATS